MVILKRGREVRNLSMEHREVKYRPGKVRIENETVSK